MSKSPIVSIICYAYNHEMFVRDTLNSFVMQRTKYPFEVIIHDDASSDKTADIIREFENKYPHIFRPIFQSVNQQSIEKGKVTRICYEKAQGKYIALCEGDDYWTDPLKLQKQVDFLEEHADCSLCFHAVEHVYENQPEKNFVQRPANIPTNRKYGIEDAILGGGGFMATNSMLFKADLAKKLPDWALKAPVGDVPLMLWLAVHGKIGYIDRNMAVYRKSTPGSWSNHMSQKWKTKKKHYTRIQEMWSNFNEVTDYKYNELITKKKRINRLNFLKGTFKSLINIR